MLRDEFEIYFANRFQPIQALMDGDISVRDYKILHGFYGDQHIAEILMEKANSSSDPFFIAAFAEKYGTLESYLSTPFNDLVTDRNGFIDEDKVEKLKDKVPLIVESIRRTENKLRKISSRIKSWHIYLRLSNKNANLCVDSIENMEKKLQGIVKFHSMDCDDIRSLKGDFFKISRPYGHVFTYIHYESLLEIFAAHKDIHSKDFANLVFKSAWTDKKTNRQISEYAGSNEITRKAMVQAIEFLGKHALDHRVIGAKSARFLIRHTEQERHALMVNVKKHCANISDLNLASLVKSRKSPEYRIQCLPFKLQWEILVGLDYPGTNSKIDLKGFKVGVFKRIMQETCEKLIGSGKTKMYRVSSCGTSQSVVNLVRFFGDYQTIYNWVTKTQQCEWSRKGVHDAGQFRLPDVNEKWDHEAARALVLKAPGCIKYAHQLIDTVVPRDNYPKTLLQLKELILFGNSNEVIPAELTGLVKAIVQHDLSRDTYLSTKEAVKKHQAKDHEMIPHVYVRAKDLGIEGNMVLRTLRHDDPIGFILGEFTGCCQSLESAGYESAVGGYTLPSQCFWVVEMGGKIIAQSWLWRSQTDQVVIDSVESMRRYADLIPTLTKLYQSAAQQILGRLGVKQVCIGHTPSGCTREVLNAMTQPVKTRRHSDHAIMNYTPISNIGLFDGRHHVVIAQ